MFHLLNYTTWIFYFRKVPLLNSFNNSHKDFIPHPKGMFQGSSNDLTLKMEEEMVRFAMNYQRRAKKQEGVKLNDPDLDLDTGTFVPLVSL